MNPWDYDWYGPAPALSSVTPTDWNQVSKDACENLDGWIRYLCFRRLFQNLPDDLWGRQKLTSYQRWRLKDWDYYITTRAP